MARAQASDTGARGASDAGARGVNSTGARGVSGVGARSKSDTGSCGASGVASDASVSKGRVALGMSGGVDSSAAAVVLMADGWEAVGVTCVFHDDARSEAAVRDAAAVCRRLGIPHTVRDSTAVFQRCVVEPFVRDYATGLTPSPCVGCNATCKVPELLVAADELGCSHVATGHYARIAQRKDDGRFLLRTALDDAKDQATCLPCSRRSSSPACCCRWAARRSSPCALWRMTRACRWRRSPKARTSASWRARMPTFWKAGA